MTKLLVTPSLKFYCATPKDHERQRRECTGYIRESDNSCCTHCNENGHCNHPEINTKIAGWEYDMEKSIEIERSRP